MVRWTQTCSELYAPALIPATPCERNRYVRHPRTISQSMARTQLMPTSFIRAAAACCIKRGVSLCIKLSIKTSNGSGEEPSVLSTGDFCSCCICNLSIFRRSIRITYKIQLFAFFARIALARDEYSFASAFRLRVESRRAYDLRI
jgi:hypothetical protein